jgi:hypothetical protein
MWNALPPTRAAAVDPPGCTIILENRKSCLSGREARSKIFLRVDYYKKKSENNSILRNTHNYVKVYTLFGGV